jgi:hypothetical protein
VASTTLFCCFALCSAAAEISAVNREQILSSQAKIHVRLRLKNSRCCRLPPFPILRLLAIGSPRVSSKQVKITRRFIFRTELRNCTACILVNQIVSRIHEIRRINIQVRYRAVRSVYDRIAAGLSIDRERMDYRQFADIQGSTLTLRKRFYFVRKKLPSRILDEYIVPAIVWHRYAHDIEPVPKTRAHGCWGWRGISLRIRLCNDYVAYRPGCSAIRVITTFI